MGIIALASAITAAIIGAAKIEKKWLKHLIAFLFTIGLSFAAYFIKWLPALGEPWWAFILLEGGLLSLASMGLYTFDEVKKLWEIIFHQPMTKVVTLQNAIPTNNSAHAVGMSFQNEIAPYVYQEDGVNKLDVIKH